MEVVSFLKFVRWKKNNVGGKAYEEKTSKKSEKRVALIFGTLEYLHMFFGCGPKAGQL